MPDSRQWTENSGQNGALPTSQDGLKYGDLIILIMALLGYGVKSCLRYAWTKTRRTTLCNESTL